MMNWILVLVGILSIPLGILFYFLTRDEIEMYEKFFSPILWILAITIAVLLSLNKTNAIVVGYIFITILSWHLFNRFRK